MQPATFSIQLANTAAEADNILIAGTDTRIKIFNLTYRIFEASANELRFYACINADQLVFETVNWALVDLSVLTAALEWYAQYIGHPQMQIDIAPPW